jgi:hypothetical protein
MGSVVSIILLKLIQLKKEGKTGDFEEILTKSYKFLMLMILPITTLLLAFPEQWGRLLGGSTFSSAGEIITIVSWILPFIVISNVFGFQLLISLNSEKQYMYIAIVGLIAALGLYLLWIPKWGCIGAAWGTFYTEVIVAIMALWLSRRRLKSIPVFGFTIKWILLLLPMYFILRWSNEIKIGAGFLLIIGPLFLLGYCLFVVYYIMKERWCFNFVIRALKYAKV